MLGRYDKTILSSLTTQAMEQATQQRKVAEQPLTKQQLQEIKRLAELKLKALKEHKTILK
jgi:hypothetical protein